ncbi:MAG TPA: glycoside hydrolase domain-containing protein [Nocardioides sp.]|uniref:glycoside hydrolase domain-containing protein n=1 Tax=Nocardioides sp. TaxID=35761 RepID=UPI002E340A6D|nr:glycoside hydrolase domain-containing protein [Nocardioides sp.]HEX5088179.1 glycoside hydrolase domain-containing protein [Nocardioides sp.]
MSVKLVFSVVVALAATLLVGGPATAGAKPAPGSLTGYAFDACSAPPQAAMDAWWQASPYAAVGVYIGGSNRLCAQPELTVGWVRTQQRRGWHVLPLFVGPQASCSGYADKMSADLRIAEQQGRQQAGLAIQAARSLGIKARSTIYYDLEDYDIAPDDCRRAALSFVSGWTEELHRSHYSSGVYSNIAAAITSLDFADRADPGAYTMPDEIWFAWANGRADVRTDSRVQSHRWDDHARVHQYLVDATQSYGGYSLVMDADWVDTGRGSVAPREKQLCRGVDVDLRAYPRLKAGRRGPAVEAAQCLLRRQHFSKTAITGRYDRQTVAGVKKAQKKLGQKVTGKLTRPTWAALLARGGHPVLKVGSTGETVRRLQRALTASGKRTPVDGVYSTRTARSVATFQRRHGLPGTGVVTVEVWEAFLGR